MRAASRLFTLPVRRFSSSREKTDYDVCIVGLGAMGSSTAYSLSQLGVSVLGLERHSLAHDKGSSHGHTRITRLAYWEHPDYVPLLVRSHELLQQLPNHSELFTQTGSIDVSPAKEATFRGSLKSCQVNGLPHEVLTPSELSRRFPAWRVPADYLACFQPGGGVLRPERIIQNYADMARKKGANLKENVEVQSIELIKDGARVHTTSGSYRCNRLLLSAGAWIPHLISTIRPASARLKLLADKLTLERQVVTWFGVDDAHHHRYDARVHPVWVATYRGEHFYGFPEENNEGIKIGKYHHLHQLLNTQQINAAARPVSAEDAAATRPFVSDMFVGVDSNKVNKMSMCIFTNTPDEHFVVDTCPDPAHPQLALISACSGHGFKFCPVFGELLAASLSGRKVASTLQLPAWLDAGRLLGDRPPLDKLDPCATQ